MAKKDAKFNMKNASRTRSSVASIGLSTLCLVLFLTFLDNTIVSVTLANVQSELHTNVVQMQWIVNGYALVFASFMLPAGALADRFGRKKLMLLGVSLFCGGSLLGALAPNTNTLILARTIMGLGAAASEPGTLSMIRQIYSEPVLRARALGIWAAVSGLALAAGPLIGGTLVGIWSWRAVFWFGFLFGLVALIAGIIFLSESLDRQKGSFDFYGFLLGAAGIAAVTFAVMSGETNGYSTRWVELLMAGGFISLLAFMFVESKAENPTLDLASFRNSSFAGSNIVALTSYFGIFSIFFFVALYLQEVGTISGFGLALDFVPMALGMMFASILGGRWVGAFGPRAPMVLGCLLSGVGIFWIDAILTPSSSVGTLGWPLCLSGLGFGLVIVPVTSTALSSIDARHSGMASSMTNTSRELGAVAAVTLLGSIINGQLTVNLLTKLTKIGIPKSLQPSVIASVTTGGPNQQISHYANAGKEFQKIVNEVVSAAFAVFKSGLNTSLYIAGGLMLASAIVAAFTIRARSSGSLPAKSSQ